MRRKKYIKYTLAELERYTKDEGSCVLKTHAQKHMGLPIGAIADLRASITHRLDAKIGRMDQKLDGIVLDIRNVKVHQLPSNIHNDNADIHIDFEANFYVFQPRCGAIITGVVKHISQQHLGVVIYRVFNVAVKLGKSKRRGKIEINQEIKIRVTSFDLSSSLPEIVGELVKEGNEDDVDSGIGADDPLLAHVKKEPKTDDSDDDDSEDSEAETKPLPKSILKKREKTKGKGKTKTKEPVIHASTVKKRVSFMGEGDSIKPDPDNPDESKPNLDNTTTFDDFERSIGLFSTQLPLADVSVKEEPPSSSQEQDLSLHAVRVKKEKKKKHKEPPEKQETPIDDPAPIKRKRKRSNEEQQNDAVFKTPTFKKQKRRRDEEVQEVALPPVVVDVPDSENEMTGRKRVKRERSWTPEASTPAKKAKRDKTSVETPPVIEAEEPKKKKKKKKSKKDKTANADLLSEVLDQSINSVFAEIDSQVSSMRMKKEKA